MRIAICDDDRVLAGQLEMMILEAQSTLHDKLEVDVFYTGEDLMALLTRRSIYDVILLDIELESMLGVEIAQWVREGLEDHLPKSLLCPLTPPMRWHYSTFNPLSLSESHCKRNKCGGCLKEPKKQRL